LLAQKAALLWANDLDTLGPCWLVATLKRLPLVYDSHEYFTEVPELQGRPLTRAVWLALERLIAPRLRYFITVTDAIAAEYRRRYGAPILTVRNVPLRREALPCAQRGAVLIYQGALNKGRGVEFLLQTMPLRPGVELWLAGAGDRVPELKRLHAELDLGARVRFLGRIPLEELPAITAQARIGLSLEEELGLSYRYGMPNKLFDYIQQHLPVIVSPLAEMAALVRRYDVGIVLEERTPQALATAVRTLLEDDTRYTHYAANAARAAEALCWEQEQEKVRALVRQALPSHEVC